MKVALITRHAVFNYGSLLQTIATQLSIEQTGNECVVIDYQRSDEDYRKIADVLLKQNAKWNKNPLTRAVYKALQSPKFVMMGKHFDKLREGRLNLTKTYASLDELRADKPQADVYMTGSDQVWGAIGGDAYDPAYFLDFVSKGDKRVSYAASFGKTDFTPELLDSFRKLLEGYDFVSVREKSAVEIISEIGIDACQVLDPTLLIDSGFWSNMIEDEFPEGYILVYQLHSNADMVDYAYRLAEKTGKQLVTMSSTAQHLAHKGSKHIMLPTLSEWLGYIKNADFMITDSFHGTAFAINFNTQFVNVLPKGTSTRNRSVLELTGLEDRVVSDYTDFSSYDSKINFESVNAKIEAQRILSFDILKNMIEN